MLQVDEMSLSKALLYREPTRHCKARKIGVGPVRLALFNDVKGFLPQGKISAYNVSFSVIFNVNNIDQWFFTIQHLKFGRGKGGGYARYTSFGVGTR
jgi:hypothetical protein